MPTPLTRGVITGLNKQFQEPISVFNALFLKWNQSINLSAARNAQEIDEHVRDSLHVVPLLQGSRVLDVGSGGGFPVVIAALCLPQIAFVSLEPVHKKHAFLRAAIRELHLDNLEAFAERLEQHEVTDYDVAMSRATFDLAEWLTLGLQHVKPTGFVIGFEGVPRDDLGPVERHPYVVSGKPRALVVRRP